MTENYRGTPEDSEGTESDPRELARIARADELSGILREKVYPVTEEELAQAKADLLELADSETFTTEGVLVTGSGDGLGELRRQIAQDPAAVMVYCQTWARNLEINEILVSEGLRNPSTGN